MFSTTCDLRQFAAKICQQLDTCKDRSKGQLKPVTSSTNLNLAVQPQYRLGNHSGSKPVTPEPWIDIRSKNWISIKKPGEAIDFGGKSVSNQARFYTDGSRKDERAGCSVVCLSISDKLQFPTVKTRLDDYIPVFEAEFHGISTALHLIDLHDLSKSSISTDSLHSLEALLSTTTCRVNSLIPNIQTNLLQLVTAGHSIHFSWVPAHKKVVGNEPADQAAKRSTSHDKVDVHNLLSEPALRILVHNKILDLWNREWKESTTGGILKKIQENVTDSVWKATKMVRSESTILTHFRTGHSHLNEISRRF